EAVLAVALMVLGAATVVTARTDWALSRRKWPIWLRAGPVLVLTAPSAPPRFGRGFRRLGAQPEPVAFTSWDSLPPTIDAGYVDLTGLPVPPPADTTL